jgi:hypothetical protein
MAVYIACDKCQKRLKIPENVVGHSIKCPSCNAVFKADPAKVLPAEQPVHTAAIVEDEEVHPVPEKVAPVEEEDRPKRRRKVAEPIDEDDEPRPPRRRRAAEYDDEEDEDYEDEVEDGRRRTPWYVMLPLIILSFCAVGLALLWPLGFSWLAMDREVSLSFESRMWVGISAAIIVTLLCLVVSLISARGWLRFLIVLLLLAIGYGGSFAAVHWWKDLPFDKDDKPAVPLPAPGQNGPPR